MDNVVRAELAAYQHAAQLAAGFTTGFAADMRAQGIHVGLGDPPVCTTCDQPWPCPRSKNTPTTQPRRNPHMSKRLAKAERDTLARSLRIRYQQGASIRALAKDTGRSYGGIHKLLTDAGVTFRSRGGARAHEHGDGSTALPPEPKTCEWCDASSGGICPNCAGLVAAADQ